MELGTSKINKGVILAGGYGTRLQPLTRVTNKHLLPIYDKPMIEYPLGTLVKAGVKEILIVSGREHAGHFVNYLGSGKDRGLSLAYKVQESADGIAHALGLAEDFVDSAEKFAVILGDNVFEDNFSEDFSAFAGEDKECVLFLTKTDDPKRFGVYDNVLNKILEKPESPASNRVIAGLYLYSHNAFETIKGLRPSQRGELEITDLNNWYLARNKTRLLEIKGFWSDAGTFDSMLASSNWAFGRK